MLSASVHYNISIDRSRRAKTVEFTIPKYAKTTAECKKMQVNCLRVSGLGLHVDLRQHQRHPQKVSVAATVVVPHVAAAAAFVAASQLHGTNPCKAKDI